MEQTRRDFIRKSVAAGGLVWVAPAISSVSTASAQTVSPCVCSGRYRAIYAEGEAFDLDGVVDPGYNNCPPVIQEGSLSAQLLPTCGTFDPATCTTTVSVANFSAGSISGTLAQATATGPTGPGDCPNYSGSSSFAALSVPGVTPTGAINETFTAGDDQLILNEQFCDPDTGEFVVRALRAVASIGGVVAGELIVAEARVTSSCCPCV